MRKLYVSIQGAKPPMSVLRAVKKAAKAAAKAEGQPFRATLLLTDDEDIRRLNRQFRNIDAPTDVLSFPSDDEDYLGDIAISLPRAQFSGRGVRAEPGARGRIPHGARDAAPFLVTTM